MKNFILLFTVLFFVGCRSIGSSSSEETVENMALPQVYVFSAELQEEVGNNDNEKISLESGVENVSILSKFMIVFSNEINSKNIENAVWLYDQVSEKNVTLGFSIKEGSENILYITPKVALAYGREYTLFISEALKDVHNQNLKNGYEGTFTTASRSVFIKESTVDDDQGYARVVESNDDRIFVSAPNANNDNGLVYVYTYDADTLTHKQELSSSMNDYEQFGSSLAIYDDLLAVGAPKSGSGGYVFVYRLIDGNYTKEWNTTSNVADVHFGGSVSLFKDFLFVSGDGSGAGVVYVYQRGDEGNYTYLNDLTQSEFNDTALSGDSFGFSLSVDEDILAVGAYGRDSGAGSVYLYQINEDSLTPIEKLTPTIMDAGDQPNFGYSVSLKGDTLAVGAPKSDDVNNTYSQTGVVYVYTKEYNQTSSSWYFTLNQTVEHNLSNAYFGMNVKLSESFLSIGATGENGLQGAYYLYRKSSDGNYTLEERTTGIDVNSYDEYGVSSTIQGDYWIIGSKSANSLYIKNLVPDENPYIYTFDANLSVSETNEEEEKYTFKSDGLGDSPYTYEVYGEDATTGGFSINSQGVLSANVDFESPLDSDRDNVYSIMVKVMDQEGNLRKYELFVTVHDLILLHTQSIANEDTSSNDFGFSLVAEGEYLFVGVPYDTNATDENVGSVWIYKKSGDDYDLDQKVFAPDPGVDDLFGYAIEKKGDFLYVSAKYYENTGENDRGVVYVFEHNSTDESVTYKDKLVVYNAEPDYASIGDALTALDDDIIIGAPNVYTVLHYRYESGNFIEKAAFTHNDATDSSHRFGISLANDTTFVAVGAAGVDYNDSINKAGAVYFYEKNASNEYLFSYKTYGPSPQNDAEFGNSLSFGEGVLAIGAQSYDNKGIVFVYEKNTSNQYEFMQYLTLDSLEDGDMFGSAVVVSGTNYIAVAEWTKKRVYLFVKDLDQGVFVFKQTLSIDASMPNFAKSLEMTNDNLFVGETAKNGHTAGTVQVYKVE